ncbi:TIGR02221 family CRISPR-associated protein [Thermophagus xiamenensis]|uniref:CRISPR-associated protein, TM1812 family n=1 Tax=Thermophagus xiamenensis TaxID=385682 RepID=A0A1I2C8L8_9BACT|nr:TIGR02221 family CRISPR-associated protein [Thermophagus xiamenensis]SFE64699.1 CRISPR-associated protein, TM1812 family [Thermophagus xiamenensis]
MARKVFLSILGNGFYEECNYYWQDKSQFSKQRFIQKACVDLFCKNWTEKDKVILYLTDAAYKNNWDKSIHKRIKNGDEYEYIGLANQLPQAIIKRIPDGKTTNEIWEIFEIIFHSLEENDEVYLDITHSFRYLPMLLLVLLNYSKYLKNIILKQITYGNYEARDSDNFAPIMDLTAFSELQDWSIAASDFVNFGQVNKIANLTSKKVVSVIRYEENKKESAFLLNKIKKELEIIAMDIQTCRGQNIISNASVDKVVQYIENLQDVIIKPLNPILQEIKKRLQAFKTNNILNGLAAVEWCLNNGLIQQGITILQETAINFTASILKIDYHNREIREIISSGFHLLSVKKSFEQWNEKCKENKDIIDQIGKNPIISKLIPWYESLKQVRNDINHSGMLTNPQPKTGNSFQKELKSKLNEFKNIITIT